MPRAYKTYTEAERLAILATAAAEQMSATDVHQRFGVKPVTYYSWRKKCGLKSPRGMRHQGRSAGARVEKTLGQESGELAIVEPGAS